MHTQAFNFKSSDGKKIFTYKWSPDNPSDIKAVVQISHGMAEHAARYTRLANYLTENNFCVYANDHRGHGKTAGDIEKLGFFAEDSGWDLVVNDMHLLTNVIRLNQT